MEKILFIRSDRFGEFLLCLPAIKMAKINHPQSKIYVMAQASNIGLVKDIDFVDYFLEYKIDSFKGFRGALMLAKIIRQEKIDCVVFLHPKKEFHFAGLLSGAKLRVGYDRKWGFCLNKKIKDIKYREEKHEVEYNIDLVKLFCPQVSIPDINLPADSRKSLDFLGSEIDLSRQYLVIHPFTSNPAKKLDLAFWDKAISRLKNELLKDVIMIGGDEDKQESLSLASRWDVYNLAGMLSLKNLAVLLKYNCGLFIGLDSGPMHLAALIGAPVVGMFKTTNPKRWGPWSKDSFVIKVGLGTDHDDCLQQILDFAKKANSRR